jgi:GPH family glycoside/pentoside/hexuronide:cation symporter
MTSETSGRLSLPTILQFAVGGIPVAALGVALFVYLPPYFASHLGVSLTLIGTCWMVVRLLDLGVDLMLGIVMDHTRTRFGRYRAWMVIGAPVFMLGVYALFMAPAHFGAAYLIFWLLVLYLGNSILTLAAAAWGAVLATNYNERSRFFGILASIGILAAITVMALPILASQLGHSNAEGVRAMGWLIIIVTPFAVGLTVWRIPERIAPNVHTEHAGWRDYWAIAKRPELIRLVLAQMSLTLGPGWMSALYMFFFTQALGFTTSQASILLIVYILVGVIGAMATGRIAIRFGKHRTLIGMTSAYSLGLCGILVVEPGNFWTALPIMMWCGFMAAGFGLMISAMMADVGDQVRLEQGKERISLLYACLSLAAKFAAAFAIGFTFPLLASFGFDPAEGAHNTPQAIHNLLLAYLIGPVFFVMLGGVCVVGWKLDSKKHGDIRAALDVRDAQFEEASIIESVTATRAIPILPIEEPAE